jgi:hypothetical protein
MTFYSSSKSYNVFENVKKWSYILSEGGQLSSLWCCFQMTENCFKRSKVPATIGACTIKLFTIVTDVLAKKAIALFTDQGPKL